MSARERPLLVALFAACALAVGGLRAQGDLLPKPGQVALAVTIADAPAPARFSLELTPIGGAAGASRTVYFDEASKDGDAKSPDRKGNQLTVRFSVEPGKYSFKIESPGCLPVTTRLGEMNAATGIRENSTSIELKAGAKLTDLRIDKLPPENLELHIVVPSSVAETAIKVERRSPGWDAETKVWALRDEYEAQWPGKPSLKKVADGYTLTLSKWAYRVTVKGSNGLDLPWEEVKLKKPETVVFDQQKLETKPKVIVRLEPATLERENFVFQARSAEASDPPVEGIRPGVPTDLPRRGKYTLTWSGRNIPVKKELVIDKNDNPVTLRPVEFGKAKLAIATDFLPKAVSVEGAQPLEYPLAVNLGPGQERTYWVEAKKSTRVTITHPNGEKIETEVPAAELDYLSDDAKRRFEGKQFETGTALIEVQGKPLTTPIRLRFENLDSHTAREASVNGVGQFKLAELPVGKFSLSATAEGRTVPVADRVEVHCDLAPGRSANPLAVLNTVKFSQGRLLVSLASELVGKVSLEGTGPGGERQSIAMAGRETSLTVTAGPWTIEARLGEKRVTRKVDVPFPPASAAPVAFSNEDFSHGTLVIVATGNAKNRGLRLTGGPQGENRALRFSEDTQARYDPNFEYSLSSIFVAEEKLPEGSWIVSGPDVNKRVVLRGTFREHVVVALASDQPAGAEKGLEGKLRDAGFALARVESSTAPDIPPSVAVSDPPPVTPTTKPVVMPPINLGGQETTKPAPSDERWAADLDEIQVTLPGDYGGEITLKRVAAQRAWLAETTIRNKNGLPQPISRREATELVERLNRQYNAKLPVGYKFRLPSIELWKQAAGTVDLKKANFKSGKTTAVDAGSYEVGGFYHLYGNVWQWIDTSDEKGFGAVGGSHLSDPAKLGALPNGFVTHVHKEKEGERLPNVGLRLALVKKDD